MANVTPEELGELNVTTHFEVMETLPKGATGDNILTMEDWEMIMIRLCNAGYEIKRRE